MQLGHFPSLSQLKMFVISSSFCLLFFPRLSPLFGHFSSSPWLVFIIIPLVIPLVFTRKTFPHPLVRKNLYSAPLPLFWHPVAFPSLSVSCLLFILRGDAWGLVSKSPISLLSALVTFTKTLPYGTDHLDCTMLHAEGEEVIGPLRRLQHNSG